MTSVVVRCKRQTKQAGFNDYEFKALGQDGGRESKLVEKIVPLNWKILLCPKGTRFKAQVRNNCRWAQLRLSHEERKE
jgi:hypothetical protein